jgi:hypothetical protein
MGDPAAMRAIWNECGYWYLPGVLDIQSVNDAKKICVDALIQLGFVDFGAVDPVWNGKDLDAFPESLGGVLNREMFSAFIEHPPNKRLFETILGSSLEWLPMDYVRLKKPQDPSRPSKDPVDGRHQDGHGTRALPSFSFVTCWVPLGYIDAATGGLAIVEGMHGGGLIPRTSETSPIQPGVIPEGAWRHSPYSPGDLVVFHPATPHSGLPNYTRQFRISMDLRVMHGGSASPPIVGTIVSINERDVTIRTDGGDIRRLIFDGRSFCCVRGNAPLTLAEAVTLLCPGSKVMALEEDGHVAVLRPQTNFENAS